MFTVFIISLIVAGILFAVYFYFCAGKIFFVNKAIKQVLNAEDVDAVLKESKPLASAWKAFENSLTRANNVRYSTVDASEFFSVAALTQGLNMTFWQSYGGIFTGLGILGTFAGLTYGLYNVNMTSGDIEVLKDGIQQLLSGVNTAFVTSLVGIAFGLFYSAIHHWLLARLGENVQSLTDKLDEKFPRRTVEDWLAEKFSEAKRQTRTLQSIDLENQNQTVALKNIGEAVSNAIHNALDEKLDDYVKVICAAIEHVGTDGSDKLDEIFTKGVGSQMDRFSAALENFTNKTEKILANAQEVSTVINGQLLATLEMINENLKRNAEAAANQRNADYEKFLATLNRLTDTLNAVVEKFKDQQATTADNFEAVLTLLIEELTNFTVTQKKLLSDNATGNTAQINEAVKAFREIVDRHNAATKKTFDQIQNLLSDNESLLEIMNDANLSFKTAADPVKQSTWQLTQNLTATSAQMKTLAEANQITRDNLAVLTTRLNDLVKNYTGIANELERSITIVTDRYSGLNELAEALNAALDELKKRR